MRRNFAESSSETKVRNLFAEIREFPRFLEKTPGTEKCNGVITLPWRLPLQEGLNGVVAFTVIG